MSKLTQAEYAEELSKLDQELKLMQKELEDNLQLNDNFQKSIEEKGDELAHKDEFIMSLREKNAAELEQLRLEQESLNDNIVHEINFHTAEVQNLRVRRNRLQELVNENERLRDSIRFLEEKVNEDRHHHGN
jgi:chromosome segregation ATPase